MELDSVLKLINAVSDSSLTSFTLDDGNTKLSFAADRAEVIKNNEFSIVRNTKEEQNSSYSHFPACTDYSYCNFASVCN
jgi:hypothetical protein